MKKQLLAIIFAICLILALSPAMAQAADHSVDTAEELRAALVAGGEIELTQNITLGDWPSVEVTKAVTLDGKGFTLSGMNVTECLGTGNTGVSGSDYSLYHGGLIGKATATVTIKDLTVTGATVEPEAVTGASSGYEYKNGLSSAAVLVGANGESKKPNTINLENVKVTNSTVEGVTKLGVFVGQNQGPLNIKNCEISGCTITGQYNYAPVAGYTAKTGAAITLTDGGGITLKNNSMNFKRFDDEFNSYIDAAGNTINTIKGDVYSGVSAPAYGVYDKQLWATSSDYYVVDDGTTSSTVPNYSSEYTIKRAAVTFEAKIGDTYYETLAAAVTAAGAGDTITLVKDVAITSKINTTKNITIDLNGKSLTATPATAFEITAGTLTMEDSADTKGSFIAEYEAFRVTGTSEASVTAKVVIGAGVKVESTKDCCIYMLTGAGADVSGSLISKGEYATIQGNGSAGKGGTEIIIREGALIENSISAAMYVPQSGSITVNGGTITGKEFGIAIKSGTLTINGGTISCIGPNEAPTTGWSNGIKASGAAIQIESNSDYAGGMEISISGTNTEISSTNGYSIYEYLGKGTVTAVNSITITGGKFKGGLTDVICISQELDGTAGKPSISGGLFTADTTAYLADTTKYYAKAITEPAPYVYEIDKTVSSIAVTPPTKTVYKVGETLDTAGLTITATLSDGNTEPVPLTDVTITGFDSSATNSAKQVIVSYTRGVTATDTFTVSIIPADGPAIGGAFTVEAPSAQGGADGKIIGTTALMECASDTGFTANRKDCSDKVTTVPAGTWYVRVKATATHAAGNPVTVNVPEYTPTTVDDIEIVVEPPVVADADTAGMGADEASAVTAAVEALKDNPGNISIDNTALTQAATTEAKTIDAGATVENKLDELKRATSDDTIEAANVNVFVQPYMDIKVTGAETDGGDITELSLSITPMAQTVISTETDAGNIETTGSGQNAVVVDKKKLEITAPITITIPLPDSFKLKALQIKHVKGDGSIYYYNATITPGSPRTAKFTVTNGFSTFILGNDVRKLAVNYDNNVSPATYTITDVGKTLPTASKSGYTFGGWEFYTNASPSTLINNATTGTYVTQLTGNLWDAIMVATGTANTSGATAAVDAKAHFTYNGGGSSSGGGGGGAPTTVPITGGGETIRVTATVSGNTATLKIPDLKQLDAVTGGNVTIDITALKRNINAVVVDTAAIKAIARTSNDLTVKMDSATVTFDAKALDAIAEQAAGPNITLSVKPVTASSLNSAQRSSVNSRELENAVIFDISLQSDGKNITDFDGGQVTVTAPYALQAGQDPDNVVVYYIDPASGELVPMAASYSKATGMVTFTTSHFSLYLVATAAGWDNPFTDVKAADWFYNSVQAVVEAGLFEGTSATTFEPQTAMTRAMFVTVLWRLEGEPAAAVAAGFDDVAAGTWYADAVAWAAANDIVNGTSDTTFSPDAVVTREQMATILYRYNNGAPGTSVAYTDAADISDWAAEGVAWASAQKLFQGYPDGTFKPRNSATRAEVATVFARML